MWGSLGQFFGRGSNLAQDRSQQQVSLLVNATLLFAPCYLQCQREFALCVLLQTPTCRAVWRAAGHINDVLMAGQTLIDTFTFSTSDTKDGAEILNANCIRATHAAGLLLLLTFIGPDSQPPAKLGSLTPLSLIPVLYFVWFRYQQSQWIIRRRPWAPSNRMRRLPVNSGVLNSQSHRNHFDSADSRRFCRALRL